MLDPAADGRSESGIKSMQSRQLKLAILLPNGPDWRELRRAAQLAAALSSAADSAGRETEVVVGLAQPDERRWRQQEKLLRGTVPSIIVRHLEWARVPVANVRRMFSDLPPTFELVDMEHVRIPRDWGWNFRDCDAWISMARSDQGAILPLRPTAHYCSGLPERYVPEFLASSIHDEAWENQAEAFRIWRQGLVLTSDPLSVPDLVSFAGVRKERIEVIPDLLDDLPAPSTAPVTRDQDLVYWLLRGNALDDLRTSLSALAAYYREGGTLDVVALTELPRLAMHPGYDGLPEELQQLLLDLPHLTFHDQAELERMLPQAAVLWSSELAGGETDALHDARRAGCHLLGPDIPLYRRETARVGLACSLYEPENPTALADVFHGLEARHPTPSSGEAEGVCRPERALSFTFLLDRIREHLDA